MRRTLLTLIALATLCMWGSAQGTTTLTAETQVKQLKSNRILIENLVDHGVNLSYADSPLKRADACRQTAQTLANYLERAAGDGDADRVAEFAALYGEFVRDGLAPNLDVAQKQIDPKSPDGKVLSNVKGQVRDQLESVRRSIPTAGKVADNDRVKAAVAIIEGLKGKFGP